MRERQFRAWHRKNKCWLYFTFTELVRGNAAQERRYLENWCDWTGLKDKNGKEIYGEGDIYKDAKGIISIVKMAVDGWALFPVVKGTPVRNLYWQNVCIHTQGKVIGNIHENPELLKGESQ